MTLAQVLRPAIRLAREGVVVTPRLAGIIADKFEKLSRYPAAAAVYLPDGLPPEAGARLVNEDLARTLESIAAGGPAVFYEGPLGRAIVADVKGRGGFIEEGDLAGWRSSASRFGGAIGARKSSRPPRRPRVGRLSSSC
jgi:gamma-glutamyltranspeptidase